MQGTEHIEHVDTIVIGGGQAGLATGYHLKRRGVPFVILDANERVGDSWRKRWDSLRLFSFSEFDSLPGLPFPAPRGTFPTKDEMASYLEQYATRFALPVRTGVRVRRLSRDGQRFVVDAGDKRFAANTVIVAMSNYQEPRVPPFASELDEDIVQFHSSAYRSPAQLRDGGVVVVGAGNSGAEIAFEVASAGHKTWLAGRDVGIIPWRETSFASRMLLQRALFRLVFHRVLSVRTPIGRKVRAKGHTTTPLIRVKPSDFPRIGITRTPRLTGVRDGKPVLESGEVLDVKNVIWSTGWNLGFSWIDLPIFDEHGEPRQELGASPDVPGLYFVGLHFLYAMSSAMVHGVGRDAERVAGMITATTRAAA